MANRTLTHIDPQQRVDTVRRMLAAGRNTNEIAAALDLQRESLRKWLLNNGHNDLHDALTVHHHGPAEIVEEMEWLLAAGESIHQIAHRLGYQLSSLERKMDRCGRRDLARVIREAESRCNAA